MTRPVICAVSDSEHARQTVLAARELALALDRDLLLVHVLAPGRSGIAEPEPLIAAMNALRRAAADAGIDSRAWRLEVGNPATQLAAVADDFDATMIVIGTADRGGELDTVAQAVAAEAPCPTVIVPTGRTSPTQRLSMPPDRGAGAGDDRHRRAAIESGNANGAMPASARG